MKFYFFLEALITFDYLFSLDLGIHCFLDLHEMIWGAYPPDLALNLSFLAKIGNVAIALGKTNASTPDGVRETEASTMSEFWETEASTMWMDGGRETKALTHIFFLTCDKPVEASTILTQLGYLSKHGIAISTTKLKER